MFGGLYNSFAKNRVPESKAFASVNASVQNGVAEARNGFGELAKRSGFNENDKCYGACYCEYDGQFEYLAVIKRNGEGNGNARLYRFYVSSGDWVALEVTNGAIASPTEWSFTQFDNYVYGVNDTDGLWRHKVGTTYLDDESWDKVTTQITFTPTGSSIGTEYPDYDNSRDWNHTTDTATAYAQGYDRGATATAYEQDSGATYTGRVYAENTTDHGVERDFTAWLVSTLAGAGSGVDFTESRYIYLTAETDRVTDTRSNEELRLLHKPSSRVKVYISGDASSVAGTWGTWRQCKVFTSGLEQHRANSGYVQIGILIDLDSTNTPNGATQTILGAVKKIAIGIDASVGIPWRVTFSQILKGGTFLSKPTSSSLMTSDPESSYSLSDIEYAWMYYKTSGAEYGPVNFLTLPVSSSYGDFLVDQDMIPFGAVAQLTIPAGTGTYATATYDKIRIWRKRHSASSTARWQRLTEVANPASGDVTFNDARVDDAEDPTSWGAAETAASLPAPTGVDDSFSGKAIAAWKQHLVVAGGKEVFFSYANAPDKYLPSVSAGVVSIANTDDPTLGRTLYIANDRSDDILAIVPDDVLYFGGTKGIYAMVGDTAATSTPARRLSASNGVVGRKAMCGYIGGVIVGSQSGLYFYRANRASTGSADTIYDYEKLTKDIDGSWKWLLSQESQDALIVREFQGEIYAICGNAFLKRNKYGDWEHGVWDGDSLQSGETTGTGTGYDASHHPLPGFPFDGGAFGSSSASDPLPGVPSSDLGLDNSLGGVIARRPTAELTAERAVLTSTTQAATTVYDMIGSADRGWKGFSASAILFEFDRTENYIEYRNDAGIPIPWFYATGIYDGARRQVQNIRVINQSAQDPGDITSRPRIVVNSFDGAATPIGTPTSDFVYYFDVATHTVGSEVRWAWWTMNLNVQPGFRYSYVVSALDANHAVEGVWIEEKDVNGGEGN